jgi:hypothetical protein
MEEMMKKQLISLAMLGVLGALSSSCVKDYDDIFDAPAINQCEVKVIGGNIHNYDAMTEGEVRKATNELETKLVSNGFSVLSNQVDLVKIDGSSKWTGQVIYECEAGISPALLNVKPELPVGACEILTTGIQTEIEANTVLNGVVANLENGNTGEEVYRVLTDPAPMSFNYLENDHYGHFFTWASWVPYDCDGAQVKTFISQPFPVDEAQANLLLIKTSLVTGGFKILDHSSEEIYTDEGLYVVYSIYYYDPSEISGGDKKSMTVTDRVKSVSSSILRKLYK